MVNKKHRGLPREPSQMDWARMAAFIDGEGCIGLSLSKRKPHPTTGHVTRLENVYLTVVNTDPRLMEWLLQIFGGIAHQVPRQDRVRHKPCYEWKVVSGSAAEILQGCLPYFIIKRDQAEIALAFQRTRLPQGGQGGRKGQSRVPQETLDLRDFYHSELKQIRRRVVPAPLSVSCFGKPDSEKEELAN